MRKAGMGGSIHPSPARTTVRPVSAVRGAAWATLVLLVTGWLGGACRQALGIETRSEGAPPLALSESCGLCVEATCAEAERACAEDADCAAIAACVAQAGLDNPTGRAACSEQNPKGAVSTAFAGVDACMRTGCQADCYGGSGFFAAYSAKCQLCTEQYCEDWSSRCVADTACEGLAVAAYAEGPTGHNPETLTALTAAAGPGQEVKQELAYCAIREECALDCGFDGHDLGCVSGYQWPRSLPSQVNLEVKAAVLEVNKASVSTNVFPGAEIDVCGAFGETCTPINSATTNALGLATVTAPLDSNAGFRGFLRVRPGELDGESTLSMNVFGYPLVRPVSLLAPTFRMALVEAVVNAFAGGIVDGRAQVVVQFFDCSARQTADVTLVVPPGVMEGAKLNPLGNGLFAIYNANPGCFDIVGHDEEGRETHRMRIFAEPNVGTWAYVLPTADPPATGYSCTPDYE